MRLVAWVLALGMAAPAGAVGQQPVYRVPVHGVIENGLAPYVARALREAGAAGAAAVVLDLDTPGGRVDAAERIVDAVRASPVPVFAFVNPRAYSAGAMIALAANSIYMRAGGVLGAATPVDGQGTKASEKIVSAMRAEFRALAEARGLDPRIAEAMVDESVVIPGVIDAGKLLTLSTNEAIALEVARAQADDIPAVLQANGIDPASPIVTVRINWAEAVVRFLTNPLVSPLLLSLGMLGLIFEIKSGAFGLGGLVSLGSLGLFFGSNLLIGLAGWEEVLMLGLGLIALAIEVFLLPGFGVAGVLGILLIGAATILAMVGNIPTLSDFFQAGLVLAAALVVTGAVVFAWLRHLPNSTRFTGLFLRHSTQAAQGFISAPMRPELIGKEGVAVTSLRPSGTARIGGERVDVVTEGDFLPAGASVVVVRSEGYRLVVQGRADLPA